MPGERDSVAGGVTVGGVVEDAPDFGRGALLIAGEGGGQRAEEVRGVAGVVGAG